jgi:hypothetical protein
MRRGLAPSGRRSGLLALLCGVCIASCSSHPSPRKITAAPTPPPDWWRLRIGQQAFLDTDRTTDEWTRVCETIPAFEVQDARRCRRRPPSTVVVQGVRDGKFGDGTR